MIGSWYCGTARNLTKISASSLFFTRRMALCEGRGEGMSHKVDELLLVVSAKVLKTQFKAKRYTLVLGTKHRICPQQKQGS